MLMVDKLCLGKILSIQSQLQVLAGESYHYCLTLRGVNVNGTHVEGMMMASFQDFSAPVSAGEGACGGLVD